MLATPIASPAAELRERLELLSMEQASAALEGLAANALYTTDLADEIVATRAAYVGAAVTEIASLRAELSGPLEG